MAGLSYWIRRVGENVPRFPKLGGQITCDVVVVGAGITGLSTAMRLQEEGKKVVVLEMGRVGKGVTGRSTAKLSSLHSVVYSTLESKFNKKSAELYAKMNERGIDLVENYVKKYKIECEFERKDNYTITMSEKEVETIQKEAQIIADLGLDATFTTETELPLPVKGAVRVRNQAQFNSYSYCTGLASAFAQNGGMIFERTRVTSVSESHQAITDSGSVSAEFVVQATHVPISDRSGHFAVLEPVRSYCLAYSLKSGGTFPEHMYITVEEPKYSIRSANRGTVLIIGGGGHRCGESPNGNTESQYELLDKFAREHFPVQEMLDRWSAQDYVPPDSLPYIGYLYRGTHNVFTATGFKKWGLAMGAVSAEILTDLMMGRQNEFADLVDARRWDLIKSAPALVKTNIEVAEHFVGDRVKDLSVPEIEDLTPGCGAICKSMGKRVAGYKDVEGNMYAVSHICTHLGCHVRWNQAEKSWDCPCHGSRFTYQGGVIHGPAVKDLEPFPVPSKATL